MIDEALVLLPYMNPFFGLWSFMEFDVENIYEMRRCSWRKDLYQCTVLFYYVRLIWDQTSRGPEYFLHVFPWDALPTHDK